MKACEIGSGMNPIFLSLLLSVISMGAWAETPASTSNPASAVMGNVVEPAPAVVNESGAESIPAEELVEEPKGYVYLVVRVKLTGTDLTQVGFMRHPAVTTLDECEAERNAGLMAAGWQHFNRGFLYTLKDFAYTADYRCVQTEMKMSYWRRGGGEGHFYRVITENGQLSVKEFDNFFACRRSLVKAENIDAFCARSTQVELPPDMPETPDAA